MSNQILTRNLPAAWVVFTGQTDLPRWLGGRGYTVVPAKIHPRSRPAPWMVFTCVEAVKRVLGLHDRFIFTPHQLYRHLSKTAAASSNPVLKGELQWEV